MVAWPQAFPGRLLLGLDARDGRVATQGWLEVRDVSALELAQQLDSLPLAGIIYTDIARDGTLEGPNRAAIAALAAAVRTPVIASGGVGSLVGSGAARNAAHRRMHRRPRLVRGAVYADRGHPPSRLGGLDRRPGKRTAARAARGNHGIVLRPRSVIS